MKRKISVALIMVVLAFVLTACGTFKCSICGQEKSGGSHTTEVFGRKLTVCDDCYNTGSNLMNGLGL